MRIKDIKIGEFYRVRNNYYGWAQILEIIPPKTSINKTRSTIVKCRLVTDINDKFGLIKYFKASDIVNDDITN